MPNEDRGKEQVTPAAGFRAEQSFKRAVLHFFFFPDAVHGEERKIGQILMLGIKDGIKH